MNKHDDHDHSHRSDGATASVKAMTARDPVCGMTVQVDQDKPSREYEGETYHFCSQKCHDKFAADPEHSPGSSRTISGCIGQVYFVPLGAVSALCSPAR